MRKTSSPNPHLRLSIHEQLVVPTTRSKFTRNRGRYESGEVLPDLDRLLERTLRAIAQSHDSRELSTRSFDSLWKKVCKTLTAKKNAAHYDNWKRTAVIKNVAQFQGLEAKLGDAWAQIYSPEGEHRQPREEHIQEYERLKQEKETLTAKSKVQTDDMLEVAIAYWIEAKNARDANDELRALHALIECWMHIGMTLSPKTESEAKSESGAKQGKPVRDKIAAIATSILSDMKVTARMADPTHLLGTVVDRMEEAPDHGELLAKYDKRATNGWASEDSRTDRLREKLMKWATDKRSPYPELAKAYRQALAQAERLKPPTTRNRSWSRL